MGNGRPDIEARLQLAGLALSLTAALSLVSPTTALAGKRRCLQDVATHTTLGTAYLNEGNCNAALSEFQRAESSCKAAAKEGEVQHRIGLAYFCSNMFEEAEARFETAIALSDEAAHMQVNLSALYLAQERWAEGQAAAKVALQDPTYTGAARAHNNVAYAALMLGALDEAEASWGRVLKLAPEFCPAWHGLGQVAERRGDLAGALDHYSFAVKCQPNNDQYKHDRGRVEVELLSGALGEPPDQTFPTHSNESPSNPSNRQ